MKRRIRIIVRMSPATAHLLREIACGQLHNVRSSDSVYQVFTTGTRAA